MNYMYGRDIGEMLYTIESYKVNFFWGPDATEEMKDLYSESYRETFIAQVCSGEIMSNKP